MSKPILIEFNGKIASISEHCKDLGVNIGVLYTRKKRTGETIEECLNYYLQNGVKYINYTYKIKNKKLYTKWANMKERCENFKAINYCDYGGRGIKVCDRWQIYENFENDMLESYLKHVEEYGEKDTTLDRIDVNDNYYLANCRWVTNKEQANNRRSNLFIQDNMTLLQFAEKYNLDYKIVWQRYRLYGWSIEKILSTPINNAKYYLPCNNYQKTLLQHCKQNDYCYGTIINYIKKYNLTPDKALAKYLKEIKNK